MSVFLLQMLAILLVDKRVWERGHTPKEARGSQLERSVGVIGNISWLSAMGYSVFLPLQPGTTWFTIGVAVFSMGSIIMALATYNFIYTPVDQVIAQGAYRFSRHPMYVAAVFICLGAGIAAGSWLLVLFSIIMALCWYQESLIEERYCLARYGNAYQEYIHRTPRLIGIPKRY
jgi:protein-S-isoprenylcysteine O-methyltransferase Ste14